MTDWSEQTGQARAWFEALRDRICAAFEAIERGAGSDARFDYVPWNRETADKSEGGGGVRGVMKGQVFEKVGVNVSTVSGDFAPGFAETINGVSEQSPGFTATDLRKNALVGDGSVIRQPAVVLGSEVASPRDVAEAIYQGALQRKRLLVLSNVNWRARILARYCPWLFERLLVPRMSGLKPSRR